MTLNDLKHRLATERGFNSWKNLKNSYPTLSEGVYDEIAKDYAKQVAEEVKKECAEKATAYIGKIGTEHGVDYKAIISKDSIMNINVENFIK